MEILKIGYVNNHEMKAIIKVYLYNSPFTICCIYDNCFVVPDETIYTLLGVKTRDVSSVEIIKAKKRTLRLTTSALFLQPFVKVCVNSNIYRLKVLSHLAELSGILLKGTILMKLILEPPVKEIVDYAWNEKIHRLVWMRVEIENAFSWLSTLGGAYSALGDYFEECAEEAGRISIRQFKLSKMLGDDSLAARSCLYSALAYCQKGDLSLSKHIVRRVAEFARRTHDKRLLRMCQGVWAKLKYLRYLQRSSQSNQIGDGRIIVKYW